MTDTAVTIVGGDEAMADLRRWADQLGPAVVKASEPGLERLADTVRARVPVLTGQLADSVTIEGNPDGADVSIGDGLDYAAWIEFGGSRGRPYYPEGRYLYPSAQEAAEQFYADAAAAADDTVGRFPWNRPSS